MWFLSNAPVFFANITIHDKKENTFMWRRRKMAKEKEEIIMEEEKLLQTVQVDGNPRLFKRSSRT